MAGIPRPLLLSFLVHFVLVLGLTGYFLRRLPPTPVETALEIHLLEVHIHHPESSPEPGKRGVPPRDPEESSPSAKDRSEEAQPESVQQAAPGPSGLPSLSASEQRDYLLTLIRLISGKKIYPRASILNEEEGVVHLRVRLGPGGKLSGVELVQSSGFSGLDEAALNALRSFSELPLPPGNTSGVQLRVPIRFEINPGH